MFLFTIIFRSTETYRHQAWEDNGRQAFRKSQVGAYPGPAPVLGVGDDIVLEHPARHAVLRCQVHLLCLLLQETQDFHIQVDKLTTGTCFPL